MRVAPATKQALKRTANALLGVWLFVVLFAYFRVLKLSGLVADLAAMTVLVVLAKMLWEFTLRPLFGFSERSTRVLVIAAVVAGMLSVAAFYGCTWTQGGWCRPSTSTVHR